jgi:hypothetical protein
MMFDEEGFVMCSPRAADMRFRSVGPTPHIRQHIPNMPLGRNHNFVSENAFQRKHKPFGGTRELVEDKGGRMIGLDILHLPCISALLNRQASYAQRLMYAEDPPS